MKNDRMSDYKTFLEKFLGDSNYQFQSLPVDCSYRSYHKIIVDDKSFILMDCPPELEDMHPFIKVTNILIGFGLSAPEIYCLDEEKGLAIIEDFGNNLMKNILLEKPEASHEIYEKAINTLVYIQDKAHEAELLDVEKYDNAKLLKEVLLFVEWYYPALFGHDLSDGSKKRFIQIWQNLFERIIYKHNTLVLRDYHAENLMILKSRKLSQEIGLLDYQDAVMGSYAYDLVSLLEDARIDVHKAFREKMITYYIGKSVYVSYKEFLSDYAVLGVQRNCKIIGVFARKAMRDKNSNYLKYLPRVWSYINDAINHPALYEVKKWMIEEKIPFIRVD